MGKPGCRVALFLRNMAGGGAERAMLNLSRELVSQNIAVDFVLVHPEGSYMKMLPPEARVVALQARHWYVCLPALLRYLEREQPTAILAPSQPTIVVSLWARHLRGFSSRLITCVQNTVSVSHQDYKQPSRGLIRYTFPRLMRKADGIVAVSEGVARDLAEFARVPTERVRVIYNPVVTPELREAAQQRPDHPWFAPGEPPVALTAGRLEHQKDHPTLLRAFAQVRAKRPARLMILGEGPDRPLLAALAQELGIADDVALPGFADNPFAYMKHAKVFVLSSLFEGLPTVLIEALACGAPVVSTDCPSGPREILAGGRYGQLVPVGDVAALAHALEGALDGKAMTPPRESWEPYVQSRVAGQYRKLLLGE